MAEYIEREALIKALESDFNTDWADYASKDYIDGVRDEYDDVLKIICTMLSADVQPIRHGRWIITDDVENFIAVCSECGRTEDSRDIKDMPYCHCGARMDGDTE